MSADVVDVLAEDCRRVSELLLGLREADFGLPTRCRPWDVKELAAHLWRSLFRIPVALAAEPPESADTDSVSYWRSYDPPTDAPAIADHARATAREHATGHALAISFDELMRDAIERARREEPGRLVKVWWGPRLRLDEFLTTRVVEVVVHGLDLTDAVRHRAVATERGLAMVGGTLEALLGRAAPARWSAIELVEKGTGRVALDETDAVELGPVAGAFPLLA
jgi:uncharacterized protein (TIGR03083 family)